MSRIFLSHASADAREALALKQWLSQQRPQLANEIFLDIDPQAGMQLGERWKGQLYENNSRCEAVICLISRNWASSQECKVEYRTAENLGKQILCARLENAGDGDITTEWQRCDLFLGGHQTEIELEDGPPVLFSTAALERLRRAIEGTGVGPENFVWPPAENRNRTPYRGWEPFEDIDAGVFFGRDAAIVRGLDELRSMRRSGVKSLFVVLGPSGSGKSSFLRAGLIPRLQREDRRFLVLGVMRPERKALTGERGFAAAIHSTRKTLKLRGTPLGEVKNACLNDPDRVVQLLEELRAAATQRLASIGPDESAPTLVLPLDQAEELFGADAGDQAEQLLTLLGRLVRKLNAVDLGLVVAATIRTDRYEAMQNHPSLATINSELFNELKPMPLSQFKEVITGPADRTAASEDQVKFGPELVERLLSDAAEGADTLPLLSLTLTRLYTDWVDGGADELTLADYLSMGGMRDVVNNEIEQILSQYPLDRQTAVRALRSAFIPWLATINAESDQPMRRVARFADLPETSRPLVDALVAKRLMVKDTRDGEVVVEVALESLLRHWDELAGWLREERQNLVIADDVERNALAWANHDQDSAWLISGSRLTDAEALCGRAEFGQRLAVAGDYLTACRAAEDERLAAEERHREAELRYVEERRQTAEAHAEGLRKRARILAAIAVVAVICTVAALYFYQRAKDQQIEATAQRLNSEAAEILSGANLGGDQRAFQELLAARALSDVPNDAALIRASANRATTVKIFDTGAAVNAAAISAEGDMLASAGDDGIVHLWDVAKNNSAGALSAHDGWVLGLAFNPERNELASAGADGTVRLWNLDDLSAPPRVLENKRQDATEPAQANSVAFEPTGRVLATAGQDGYVLLWNTDDIDAPPHQLNVSQVAVNSIAFGPFGRELATADEDGTVKLWRIDDLSAPIRVLTTDGGAAKGVALSPKGHRLASASDDGKVRLWNLDDVDAPAHVYEGHTRAARSVAFSADGHLLASGGDDMAVRLWNVDDAKEPARVFNGHTRQVNSVAFAATGHRLVSGSYDESVRLWDPDLGRPFDPPLSGHNRSVLSVAFSTENDMLASAEGDGTVRLWDLTDTAEPIRVLKGNGRKANTVAFRPRTNQLAVGQDDGTVQMWDADTGASLAVLRDRQAPDKTVFGIAFSPDGNRLASTSFDGLRLWDLADTTSPMRVPGSEGTVNSVAFSGDGRQLVSGGADKMVRLWDAETGAQLAVLEGHHEPVRGVAFSSDGHRIASASFDDTVRLWNADTEKLIGEPLRGHTGDVLGVAFSPDGHRLASVSADQTVRLWDGDSGASLGALTGHIAPVDAVAYSPDQRWLASGSVDRTVRIWPGTANPDALCDKLTTNMSTQQWSDWVSPDIRYETQCDHLHRAP